jgi:hypothetical protein
MSNILAAVTRLVSKAGAGRSCEVRSSQGVKPEEPTCKNESVSAGAYPGQSCPFRTNLVNISAALIIDVTAANSVVTNAK